MLRARSGRLARFVAVMLLLWAGADLVDVNLCAIDRPPIGVPGRHQAIVADTSSQAPVGFPVTGDDCFCCSHNALSAAAFVLGPQAGNVEEVSLPRAHRAQLLRTRLDHPPQLV